MSHSNRSTRKPAKPNALPNAPSAPPPALLLTVSVNRESGAGTIFGNAESLRDFQMLADMLEAGLVDLREKRLTLAVAAAVAAGKEVKP